MIESLEALLGQFSQWDNYQRLAREVGRLRREQEQVYSRTQQLRVDTLTKDPNDLTAEQRANLRRLTERQNDIALRFNALTSGMELTQQKLLKDDPVAAATLADALDMVRQAGIGGLMRDVGQKMDGNRLGQAADQQDIVLQYLSELQDILANRRQYQLDRKVQQLRDAASQLERIRARQQAIQQQLDEAPPKTSEQLRNLGNREAELAGPVSRLARRMRRLAG